jgi:hypothetical protein
MRPTRFQRWQRVLAAFAIGATCLFVAALPGDAAPGSSPRSLAALIPQQATAMIETDDLRALLKRWSNSKLHERWDGSRAEHDLERSRLYLRLAQNVGELEEVAGFGISLDRLKEIAGHRSAVALFDVPSTSFVLVTELTSDEAKRSDIFGQRGKMGKREHRGIPYLLKEGAHGKASLAVAQVGDRLIAGTDLPAFRDTLVLAARASGINVAGAVKEEPQPLAGYGDFSSLDAIAPRAPVRMWVNQKELSGRHYFDDYWIFGKETGAGIDAAMVTFTPGSEVSAETRIYQYADGKRPDVSDGKSDLGKADVVAATAPLPSAPPFASAWPTDGEKAASAIAELLPRGRPGEEPDDLEAIQKALDAAKVRRALEVVEPSHVKGGFAEHHGGIAFGLGAADALDGKALEAAIAGVLAPRVTGAGSDLAFSDEGDLRVLKLPLVSEWSLSWKRVGNALVIATDPAAAKRMLTALGSPQTAALLNPTAPRLYRLDVDRAGVAYRDVAKTLAVRSNWSDVSDAELFEESLGGLFDVVKDDRRVVAYGYARGPRQYVEEVQYRTK